jgi:hypothetical protein
MLIALGLLTAAGALGWLRRLNRRGNGRRSERRSQREVVPLRMGRLVVGVLAERAGDDLLRLCESPATFAGYLDETVDPAEIGSPAPTYGDLIRVRPAANGDLLFAGIAERSPLVRLSFVIPVTSMESGYFREIAGLSLHVGGGWEVTTMAHFGFLRLHVPAASRRDFEKRVETLCRMFPLLTS